MALTHYPTGHAAPMQSGRKNTCVSLLTRGGCFYITILKAVEKKNNSSFPLLSLFEPPKCSDHKYTVLSNALPSPLCILGSMILNKTSLQMKILTSLQHIGTQHMSQWIKSIWLSAQSKRLSGGLCRQQFSFN